MSQWRSCFRALIIAALCAGPKNAEAADLTVFAAASLETALDAVDAAFTETTSKTVAASYAASSALAKQIEGGAPADIFISADTDWMDDVARHGAVREGTRSNLLGNRLVLITQASRAMTLDIVPGMPIAAALGDGRLAIPDPDSVPAGKYGKAALTSLGVWSSVEEKLAPAENVRAALAYVSRGEAPLGIVYATDAVSEKGVGVVGTFPENSHPPIVYPVAITVASNNAAAQSYLDFLRSAEAQSLFEAQGFSMLR